MKIEVHTSHRSGQLMVTALVRCAFHIGEQELGCKVTSFKLVTEREFNPNDLDQETVQTFGIVELECPDKIDLSALKGEGHEIVKLVS